MSVSIVSYHMDNLEVQPLTSPIYLHQDMQDKYHFLTIVDHLDNKYIPNIQKISYH